MPSLEKLLEKLLRFPPRMRFSDVKRILEAHGYQEVRVQGSHHIFRKAGTRTLPISTVGGREVKVDYLKDIAAELGLRKE